MAKQATATETHWMVPLASIAIIVAALYLAKGLIIPMTLAVLLSFLLSPVCDYLERRRLGRIPAVLVTALLGFTVLVVAAWAATRQMSHLATNLPEYSRNIELRLEKVNAHAVSALSGLNRSAGEADGNVVQPDPEPADRANGASQAEESPASMRIISALAGSLESFGGTFGTLLELLGTIGIVIVLVIFFLIRREDLRDRFIHLLGKGHVTLTTQILEDANSRVKRYLTMLFLINATYGISAGVGLYFIGVPNAVLWGILAGSLRFIPYIGPWMAGVIPLALALAISTGWRIPLLTIGLFVVLELICNNVMEPWLYGKNTGVSSVGVVVAATFCMWLWGPVGLLLATPLTVCILVVGKHVPQLSFLVTLLGNDPVFEPKTRIYQRLLAGDQEEAADLLVGFLKHESLVETYDAILVPAIALTEKHWQLGELNEEKHQFIMQCLREMIHDCGDRRQAVPASADPTESTGANEGDDGIAKISVTPLNVLCLPARTQSDALTTLMLSQVLKTTSSRVQALAVTTLGSEMVDWVDVDKADVICVCATLPTAVMDARYVCKQIRDRLPDVKLIVGLWDTHGDLDRATERFGHHAVVVSTMAEAEEQIRQLITPAKSVAAQPTDREHDAISETLRPQLVKQGTS